MLRNIPEGRSAIDACMNVSVEIKGVNIWRPYRCKLTDGSPHTQGIGWWIGVADVQKHPRTNGLELDQLYEPYSLRGTSELK